MSAFLCSAYHIGRLAAFAAHDTPHRHRTPYLKYHAPSLAGVEWPETELAPKVAAILAAANVASIQERYKDTQTDFANAPGVTAEVQDGPIGYIAECAQAARLEWREDHPASDIIQACDCFDYQSCEYDGWKTSEARALLIFIKVDATAELLQDVECHGWELDPARAKRVTLLSDFAKPRKRA